MLFVHSPEEAQRAKRRDFLIHFILFLFLFSFFKVPTLSWFKNRKDRPVRKPLINIDYSSSPPLLLPSPCAEPLSSLVVVP